MPIRRDLKDFAPRPGAHEGEPRGLPGRVRRFFARTVWEQDVAELGFPRRPLFRVARILYLVARGFVQDACMFRASALTYITVLSIVPLLAFAFSAAKGFGAFESLRGNMETLIAEWFPDEMEGPVLGPEPAVPAEPEPPAAEREVGAAGGEADVAAEIEEPEVESPPEEATEEEAASTVPGTVRSVATYVLDLVEQTDFQKIGALGLVVLLYTVIKLIGTIERSLNAIWGIHRGRSLARKVTDYLSILILAPILFSAVTYALAVGEQNVVVDFMRTRLGLDALIAGLVGLTPLLAMCLGFAFVYLALPNTRTKVSSSLIAGLVAGTLWVGLQKAHVQFQIGTARYNEIYSGFAAIPIFLVWVYASWVIVLLGAEVAHAHQSEPDYRAVLLSRSEDHAFQELVALRLMARVARNFLRGGTPPAIVDLAAELGVPLRSLDRIVDGLDRAGIVAVLEGETGERLLPARDLDRTRVKEVLDALSGTRGPVEFPARADVDRTIDGLLAALAAEREESPHNLSLRDLAREAEQSEPRPDESTVSRAAGDLGLEST